MWNNLLLIVLFRCILIIVKVMVILIIHFGWLFMIDTTTTWVLILMHDRRLTLLLGSQSELSNRWRAHVGQWYLLLMLMHYSVRWDQWVHIWSLIDSTGGALLISGIICSNIYRYFIQLASRRRTLLLRIYLGQLLSSWSPEVLLALNACLLPDQGCSFEILMLRRGGRWIRWLFVFRLIDNFLILSNFL